MRDVRIYPKDIRIGDVITSDPRRDFEVDHKETDDFGDVTIYTADGAKAYIHEDQTVAIRPRS